MLLLCAERIVDEPLRNDGSGGGNGPRGVGGCHGLLLRRRLASRGWSAVWLASAVDVANLYLALLGGRHSSDGRLGHDMSARCGVGLSAFSLGELGRRWPFLRAGERSLDPRVRRGKRSG